MSINMAKIRRHVVINNVSLWISASTEQEYCDNIIAAYTKQVTSAMHNFKKYAMYWYNTFSAPNVREVTRLTYLRELNNHIFPVVGDMMVEDITAKNIQDIFSRMGQDAKLETKHKTKIVLNQVLKLAQEENIITVNPLSASSIRIKGLASTVTKPYTVEQMQMFANALPNITNRYDKAWLALAISLPLRCEEILGLKWQDVTVDGCVTIRNTVTHPTRNNPVFQEYTKTNASRRTLMLPQSIMPYLSEREADNMFVVGGVSPLSYTQVQRMMKRLQKETSFNESITPRRFRTTVATDISSTTHDLKLVQQMLGHSTPQMTLKHYDKGRSTTQDATDAIVQCYKIR